MLFAVSLDCTLIYKQSKASFLKCPIVRLSCLQTEVPGFDTRSGQYDTICLVQPMLIDTAAVISMGKFYISGCGTNIRLSGKTVIL